MVSIVWARTPFVGPRPWVFLAGPTPRDDQVKSWRPEAVEIFEELGFKGTLLIPEDQVGGAWYGADQKALVDAQIDWEWEGIDLADIVLFWVPRITGPMEARTTNIEFGYLLGRNDNVTWGAPPEAPNNYYMTRMCGRHGIDLHDTLEGLIRTTIEGRHQ